MQNKWMPVLLSLMFLILLSCASDDGQTSCDGDDECDGDEEVVMIKASGTAFAFNLPAVTSLAGMS